MEFQVLLRGTKRYCAIHTFEERKYVIELFINFDFCKQVSAADTLSAFTSMSLQRQWTGNPDDHYRGSSNNIPFLPGT